MSFLNEEQASLIKVVADFAKQEIAPNAAHYDETEEFPWDKEFPLIRDSQKCIKWQN